VSDPVLVGDERHLLPGGAVLEADRLGGLHVLPEGAEVESAEIAAELEVDVQLLAPLERSVNRLHHLAILVARDLPRGAEAENTGRQIGDLLNHAPSVNAEVTRPARRVVPLCRVRSLTAVGARQLRSLSRIAICLAS
jgi:hypothetical protein